MKIEPFPWLRDYYVDMTKLYTELILEKIENELLGEKIVTLQGYEEMFNVQGRDKILIQADLGMGKTTLLKKIWYDWVRGVFKMYSMVFFVFLKFIQPGEQIENVFIKQTPELEGLGVSPQKLREILERFSDRCLLILDGLDEHGLGQNKDVLKIIKNQKLLDCGIIVSSRPHSTREVENDFPTVIRVGGFNNNEARRFISNFFTDEIEIEKIMKFTPSDVQAKFPIQQCPILLSFFCFLVAEHEIDLSDETISMGNIYTRLVKCLYKKYTIRKGIKFELNDFVQVLKSVGKLALTTLISNDPLLKRSEVHSVVGDFAFEYGLFAGHEDFRLSGDLIADIYVTYPHRSLEEFFGSFGFCQALSEGDSIEEILGTNSRNSLLLVNPLFLKFTLCFLSTTDFDFPQRKECYDKITSYVASHIDSVEFDAIETSKEYPAFDVLSPTVATNSLKKSFYSETLAKSKSVKTFKIKFPHAPFFNTTEVDKVLKLMNTNFFNNLTKIIVGNLEPQDTDDSALTLAIDSVYSSGVELLRLLMRDYNLSHRNPQVYLRLLYRIGERCDVIELITEEVKELYKYIKQLHLLSNVILNNLPVLEVHDKIPHCPVFRHLMVREYHIDGSVPSAFREALRDGNLDNFKIVTLWECCGHMWRHLCRPLHFSPVAA